MVYGSIEAGGTKFVCAVGTGPGDLREESRFPTEDPAGTIAQAIRFLREAGARQGGLKAVGIASFGPIDLAEGSPTWGYITTTPKLAWQHTDLAGEVGRALGVPVGFDTDVNGAALAESRWGAGQGLGDLVYITVGTGIGGGAISGGRLVHGALHPEMGHLQLPREPDDGFAGACPFHGGCLEGLASGPAIEQRWGNPGAELPTEHPAWDLQARYLASAAMNIALTLSPRKILLGGGVMAAPGLIEKTRAHFADRLKGYLQAPAILAPNFLCAPGLGDKAGVLGGIALALDAAGDQPD